MIESFPSIIGHIFLGILVVILALFATKAIASSIKRFRLRRFLHNATVINVNEQTLITDGDYILIDDEIVEIPPEYEELIGELFKKEGLV